MVVQGYGAGAPVLGGIDRRMRREIPDKNRALSSTGYRKHCPLPAGGGGGGARSAGGVGDAGEICTPYREGGMGAGNGTGVSED